jgi:hypothetical protein
MRRPFSRTMGKHPGPSRFPQQQNVALAGQRLLKRHQVTAVLTPPLVN